MVKSRNGLAWKEDRRIQRGIQMAEAFDKTIVGNDASSIRIFTQQPNLCTVRSPA